MWKRNVYMSFTLKSLWYRIDIGNTGTGICIVLICYCTALHDIFFSFDSDGRLLWQDISLTLPMCDCLNNTIYIYQWNGLRTTLLVKKPLH